MNTLQTLCTQCVERADAFGWKGKTGDKLAFEFMVGACAALLAVDHVDAKHVQGVVAMLIAVRGLVEVRRIASDAKTEG